MQIKDRPEPELGQLDGIDTDDRRPPMRRPSRPPRGARTGGVRFGLWLFVALIAAAGATVYVMRDELRRHFPGSETRELLNAAARAEAEGRWQGDADGQDALALYQRLLLDDPDNDAARLGLRRVGAQLESDAHAAIAAGDFDAAQSLITGLERIGESGDRVAALRQRLQSAQTEGSELSELLAQGQAALERRRIRGENGALAAFKRMLALEPANAVAQRGVDDALQILIEEAGNEAAAGRLDSARRMADAVASERPQHAGLPTLLQSIAEAETVERARAAQSEAEARAQAERTAAAERARIDRETLRSLKQGDDALRAGKFDTAIEAYRRVIAQQPGHAEAREGLSLAARASLEQARAALADSDPTRAAAALALARQAQADPDALARLEHELADLNERLTAVLARPELDAEQQARLDTFLARAQAADSRGDLVEPAGDSAYDLYRQVLSIDPMNDEARQAVYALPRRAQTLAVHHAELGQLDQAVTAVRALQAMAPLDPSLPELKRQIASAWLERGSVAVRNGAIGDARHALDQARALAPGHPGIPALARELSGG